jgi:mannitol operon repressor
MTDKFIFKELSLSEDHELFPHMAELNKLRNEINQETDRGAALFSASLLDEALQSILSNFFVDSAASKKLFKYPDSLSTFSARQNLCLALGLISKVEFDECTIIRSIRNKFAHNAAYSVDFKEKKIASLCDSFRSRESVRKIVGDKSDFNRVLFIINVTALLVNWFDRSEIVKKIRRVELMDDAISDLK